MTDTQINRSIAEACGWEINEKEYRAKSPDDGWWEYLDAIPNYCKDLNAMHEAEKNLSNECWWLFVECLTEICGGGISLCISANPKQRAEAFLKAIGKWEGEQS